MPKDDGRCRYSTQIWPELVGDQGSQAVDFMFYDEYPLRNRLNAIRPPLDTDDVFMRLRAGKDVPLTGQLLSEKQAEGFGWRV